MKNNLPTTGFYAMLELSQRCGEKVAQDQSLHLHDYYSVYWINAGEAIHATKYIENSVAAVSLFFVPSNLAHRMIVNDDCKGYGILFDANFIDRDTNAEPIANLNLFNNPDFQSVLDLTPEENATIASLISSMQEDFNVGDFNSIYHYLKILLHKASELYLKKGMSESAGISGDSIIIVKFKKLIEENYKTNKEVSFYADLLRVSPVTLNDISKNITNLTAGEMIRNRIIREAKKILFSTELSSKEIAFDLGFDDPSYFSRFFKKYTNQTLTDFRTLARTKK